MPDDYVWGIAFSTLGKYETTTQHHGRGIRKLSHRFFVHFVGQLCWLCGNWYIWGNSVVPSITAAVIFLKMGRVYFNNALHLPSILCDHSGQRFRGKRQLLLLMNMATAGGFPGMVAKNAGLHLNVCQSCVEFVVKTQRVWRIGIVFLLLKSFRPIQTIAWLWDVGSVWGSDPGRDGVARMKPTKLARVTSPVHKTTGSQPTSQPRSPLSGGAGDPRSASHWVVDVHQSQITCGFGWMEDECRRRQKGVSVWRWGSAMNTDISTRKEM